MRVEFYRGTYTPSCRGAPVVVAIVSRFLPDQDHFSRPIDNKGLIPYNRQPTEQIGSTLGTRHLAIDGSRVELTLGMEQITRHMTSSQEFMWANRRFEIVSHRNVGFATRMASNVAEVALTEEFDLWNGSLKVGERHVSDETGEKHIVAAWSNEIDGSLYMFATTTIMSISDLVQVWSSALSIQRHEDGFAVDFVGGAVPVSDPELYGRVSELGMLDILPLTPEVARSLPPHRGTAVRAGELFVDRHIPDRPYFIHVSDSAKTSVIPEPDADLAVLSGLLATFDAKWSRL